MVNGSKIRALREEKELSIEQLARAVCSSQTMISYIETGVKKPSVELLKRIADYFGCTVDELLRESA